MRHPSERPFPHSHGNYPLSFPLFILRLVQNASGEYAPRRPAANGASNLTGGLGVSHPGLQKVQP